MAESYLEIREQLESAITNLAALERELGTDEEMIEPVIALAEALHSPFCMVVLGEKGSGKSSLLNAFIREELSPLDVSEEKIKVFRHGKQETNRLIADDLEECARPLPALHNFTLIDTPANLLLGDARLLTRDIFPIADLVLCVFSVGNPWAPSTWEFLRNVKKEWLSKVVFVVQQADLRDQEEAQSVAKSLATHALQSLGVAPVLFAVSANKASLDAEARKSSGIEALENFVEERRGASHAHIEKARQACRSARGPLIEAAERVRGTLFVARLEQTQIDELAKILEECKQRSHVEVQEITRTVNDSHFRSQAHGEEFLKSKLTLLETLKSAFLKNTWELPVQEELEKEVSQAIARTTETIKTDLLSGSQRFLESSVFKKEDEQQAIGVTLSAHGRQLSEQIRKTLSRNRTEGLEDAMNDIMDAAGTTIRAPALASAVGLIAMLILWWLQFPTIFGLTAAATAVAISVTLLMVVQKHAAILAEYHLQVGQKRERVISTIDRQLNEAIDIFCDKHLLMVPSTNISKPTLHKLEPFLPKIKDLEDTFSGIESKLDRMLAEVQ